MRHAKLFIQFVLVLLSGCGDGGSEPAPDPEGDRDLAKQVLAHLKKCEVYFAPLDPRDDTIRDETDRCIGRCLVDAPCDALVAIQCRDGLPASDPLAQCVEKCPTVPDDGYVCKQGDLTIAHRSVCDGLKDCDTGEDEVGCKPFVCESGEEIVDKGFRCDGAVQCEDGSDEDGCPLLCQLPRASRTR